MTERAAPACLKHSTRLRTRISCVSPPDARTGGEDPKGEGVRADSMLRPYLTLAGERPWQSPVTGHLVWDRDDDIALLVPLLDVSVGFGDLL